jgi:hypothetical protein
MIERLKELCATGDLRLGSIVARVLGVLLLPLYTRYLTPSDYGLIETLIALSAVLTALVAQGMKSAFFRFYFDSAEPERRHLVVRTAFWYVMAASTVVTIAGARSHPSLLVLFGTHGHRDLVIAAFVGLWAALNYEQMTSLFRVEQRSTAYVTATLANVAITIAATILLVVVFDKGPLGVLVGNFTGTLIVYAALLVYSRHALGLQFDRPLYRAMNRFGLPLVPSAVALWLTNFSDRFFLIKLADAHEVGLYSIGVRVASAIVLLLTAFRMAWPAFAYSIDDDREAQRTYSFVLTYVVFVCCWLALASDARVDREADHDEPFFRRRTWSHPSRSASLRSALRRGSDRHRPGAADAFELGRDRHAAVNVALNQRSFRLMTDGSRDPFRRRLHALFVAHGLARTARLPCVPVAACRTLGLRPSAHRAREAARRARSRLCPTAAFPVLPLLSPGSGGCAPTAWPGTTTILAAIRSPRLAVASRCGPTGRGNRRSLHARAHRRGTLPKRGRAEADARAAAVRAGS